jgi:uncharacterized glyoxalase superfamily protein PhnB/uncharacterized protein YndB with AHSA1/START domain
MSKTILMDFQVDKEAKQIKVTREFDAPRDLVWRAWTEKEILDQWWAPKPWKAETKSLDFREGGRWHYCMAGPKGEKHWCFADYKKIDPKKKLSWLDAFCDENMKVNTQMPRMSWENKFSDADGATLVNITINFDKPEDLQAIVDTGFKEGFTMGLENLDQWLSTQFKLRNENKTSTKARVCTYLNFPGNTEEAMNFYKKVFRGEFVGRGLQRFADIEMPAGAPPMKESDKKLIIHAELKILGGHILMATDAPESMGFTLVHGNNMHINLEPDSREETERLFKELTAGGQVTMPLQDMFFGVYFAEFKDRFGINWMLSHHGDSK